ncbi:hypothetical protein J2X06_001239 [Lysobacter niastensis]|uniref:Uncharacterized protein n=1 Tax=Lysobacter niastensis TaxID=380629 RepID=A0ABU1W9S6_9GAMM|nr:hypothetical protein [Lysobacter niastensis]MDR7134055.1 hypothetical protein [Lysobacter niastensis]
MNRAREVSELLVTGESPCGDNYPNYAKRNVLVIEKLALCGVADDVLLFNAIKQSVPS